MADYITKSDLTSALNEGFDNAYKNLTKHFDERFDKLERNISEINEKYNHLIDTLDTFLK